MISEKAQRNQNRGHLLDRCCSRRRRIGIPCGTSCVFLLVLLERSNCDPRHEWLTWLLGVALQQLQTSYGGYVSWLCFFCWLVVRIFKCTTAEMVPNIRWTVSDRYASLRNRHTWDTIFECYFTQEYVIPVNLLSSLGIAQCTGWKFDSEQVVLLLINIHICVHIKHIG